MRPPHSCLEVPRVAERPPPVTANAAPDSEPGRFSRARWKHASKTGQAARRNARHVKLGTRLVLGHIVGRVGARHRRPQLQGGLGADEVVGLGSVPRRERHLRSKDLPAWPVLTLYAGSSVRFSLEGPPTPCVPRCSAESGLSNTVLMSVSSASAIRTPAPTPSHGRTPLVPRAPSSTAEATSPAVTRRSRQGSNLAPSSSAR